jgi:outer membrane immunogenic protein
MKQLLRLTTLLGSCAALALTVVAGPEPLPSGKEMKQVAPAPVPECDFTWTGFYIGVNVGYGWGNADTDFDPLPDQATFGTALAPTTLSDLNPDGIIAGGQIGFNWQWNKWLVLGAEADFQGTDMEDAETESPIQGIGFVNGPDSFLFTHERMQWFGTVRGRIGFAPWCRLLIYGTGGLAYGNVDYAGQTVYFANSIFLQQFPASFTETNVGWTVGGGLEYAFGRHWSVRAEYLYYDLGDQDRSGPFINRGVLNPPFAVHYNWETNGNIVRGGVNFKF